MLAGQFAPCFRIDLHHKDMGTATAGARKDTARWTTRPCCEAWNERQATRFRGQVSDR